MIAIINEKIDIVTRLLETGKCNVNYRNCDNDDALFFAFSRKNSSLEIIHNLIMYGSDPYRIYKNGDTILHLAARQKKDPDILKCAISLGLDINQENDEGVTPLDLAIRFNNENNVKILLERKSFILQH